MRAINVYYVNETAGVSQWDNLTGTIYKEKIKLLKENRKAKLSGNGGASGHDYKKFGTLATTANKETKPSTSTFGYKC